MSRPTARPVLLAALAASCALAATACNLAGPTALRAGRQDYNVAVQQTQNEQLLLNLVRLRYLDTPQFLEVGNITASYQFDAGVTGSATLPEQRNSANSVFGATVRMGWIERPTVTMQPLQGERFVTQMLTPMTLETLLLLVHSGWSVERVLRVCLQHLNGVPNAPTASGPTPALAPEFRDFRRLTAVLRRLQLAGRLHLGLEGEGDARALVLRLPDDADEADARELRALLGVAPDAQRLELVASVSRGSGERVGVGTRSLMGALFYVSQGVQVPEDDAPLVTTTRTESGARFSWDEVLEDLFRVGAGAPPEGGAAVCVSYRGRDFYLADHDLPSKTTFALLQQLVALQAGGVQSAAPVLTIAVGG